MRVEKETWGWLALAGAGLAFPLLARNDYHLTVMSTAYIFAIATLGLNIITGYTGQFNLAHAGFMAIGAYTLGILTVDYQVSFWLAFLLAGIVTAAIGLPLGWISLRLRGHYFSIFTLCVGTILFLVIEKWESLTHGTVGIIALTVGGLLGGWAISRRGLKAMLWPMILATHVPVAAFLLLALYQPTSLWLIGGALAVEQFGYGFGFTAYMLYMMLVADGPHKTAHYAICTGFMALGMMIPGMWTGWIQEIVGYQHFFVWIMICTIPGFIVTALIKPDPQFGQKTPAPAS